MKNQQLVQIVALTVLVGSIGIGVRAISQTTSLTGTRAQRAAGAQVYADPKSIEAGVNDRFTVAIKVQTGEGVVGGMFGSVEFDPNYLRLEQVSAGPFFTSPSIVESAAKVNISAQERVVGNGTVAYLVFSGVQPGVSEVTFGENFELVGVGSEENVLNERPSGVAVEIF